MEFIYAIVFLLVRIIWIRIEVNLKDMDDLSAVVNQFLNFILTQAKNNQLPHISKVILHILGYIQTSNDINHWEFEQNPTMANYLCQDNVQSTQCT